MVRRVACGVLAGCLVFWLSTSSVRGAASVKIDDSGEGAPVVTVDNLGPGQNWTPISSDVETVHFTVDSGLGAAPGQEGVYYWDFLEPPSDPNPGAFSDRLVLTLVAGSPIIDVQFASDPSTINLSTSGQIFPHSPITEDGTFQYIASYINLGDGTPLVDFYVKSDVVPTPAAAGGGLLLLAGLAAGGWVRKHRRG